MNKTTHIGIGKGTGFSILIALALSVFMFSGTICQATDEDRACDAHSEDTLYTIGYAHLDTQWRWTFQDSIYKFVVATMRDNFELFEKFPAYHFNFTGSKRYIMMKEYYPEDFEVLKDYVEKGQWLVSGASVDENDANVPSTESLVRNVMYGNLYFKNEFGKITEDYMLPDCFGFPAFMPSVLAHAGIKGFSTQKLTWRSAVGIPFNVGVWEGPDGRTIMAALNPGAYVSNLTGDLSHDKEWLERVQEMGEQTGFHADFKYFGTGDRGGAPNAESVKWLQTSVDGDGPLCVDPAQSDDIFQDANEQEMEKMTHFKGDMLLIEHSAGSLTSQAYMKRWNRKNELLADNAERASLIADWLGAIPYQTDRLREIWYLILGSQMHDILPGTSVPKAYEYSWNDEVMALNGSAGVIDSAVGAASILLDTNVTGQPVVVYNPLSIDRNDYAQADVVFEGAPKAVQVFDADGKETPSQIIATDGNTVTVLFIANVPSVGYAVYDVRKADAPSSMDTGLSVSDNQLENERFVVKIDENGDVASIFDKVANKEALSAPAGLEFMFDKPRSYPAWNIDWNDWQNPARAKVSGPAKVKVIENGPARVAVEVTRELEGSTFVQRIRLASGDAGSRVEFDNSIDWRTMETTLKAAFPLNVNNENASYNLELGVIERNTNHSKKFEVPSHQWFDLTDADGSYGVSVLEDSKFASDKPNENTIRLTLIRTPGCNSYCDQATQDLGKHEVLFALAPHKGDWREGNSHWQALSINQPLTSFTTPKHDGALGGSFSFLKVSSPQVAVRAAKMAEESDEIIIRLQELSGEPVKGLTISFPAPVISAREVDGQEREIGPATIKDGALTVDIDPFYMSAYAVKIGDPKTTVAQPVSTPINLDYNLAASTLHKEETNEGFDGAGNAYPADLLPKEISMDGIDFKLAQGGKDKPSAVACKGQSIDVPAGTEKVYILAAASGGDAEGVFKAGGKETALTIQEWTGYVGQWDNRIWKDDRNIYGLKPAFTKRDEIAWTTSQYHNGFGRKMAYNYSYIFKYAIDVPAGATSITLPSNESIKILAATAVTGDIEQATPAQLLYDDFKREEDAPFFSPSEGSYDDTLSVKINFPWYSMYQELHYTTDGSEVTMDSPLYISPVLIAKDTTVKARAFGENGKEGLLAVATYKVKDVTPPSPVKVNAFELAPTALVQFSEPVEKASAENAANYSIEPGVEVKAATLGAGGQKVLLQLSSIPSSKDKYTLTVNNVKDVSAAANAISEPTAIQYHAAGPAYEVKIKTKDISYSLGVPGVSNDYSIVGKPKTSSGPFGLALRLNGDGQCISINNRNELNPTTEITLSAWVRARTWEGNRRILQKGNEDNQYRLLSENGKLMFDLAGVGVLTSELPKPGDWTHVAATYDGMTMKIYINGKVVAEKSASGNLSVTSDPLHIGTKHTNASPVDFYVGDMDKISVWGYALSAQNIAILAEK